MNTGWEDGGVRTSVIVPSYRRPASLHVCLRALEAQTRHADQVVVVIREDDPGSRELIALSEYGLTMDVVSVSRAGQVAALNAGLQAARGNMILFTDDDAAPRPTWLSQITERFLADSAVGGVGGADHVTGVDNKTKSVPVGRVQWFGRCIGNHHLGTGAVQPVDILKGVNMAFRRAAILGLRFDERLHGSGAQVHNDLAFSLAVRDRGWKLLYDPLIIVDHYVGPRYDEDTRGMFDPEAVTNAVHNETLTILEHVSWPRKMVFLLWAVICGTSAAPGLIQCARWLIKDRRIAFDMLVASLRGRLQGLKSFMTEYPSAEFPVSSSLA